MFPRNTGPKLPAVLIAIVPGLMAAPHTANAQIRFHAGVEAGVPASDTLMSASNSSSNASLSSFDRYHSSTKRLLAGPGVRIELGGRLGVELDALYQRVNYDHAQSSSSPPNGLSSQS